LERSSALDTTFLLPRLYTALMLWNLRDLAHMDSVLQRLAVHSDKLTPFERVLLDHFKALLAGDNETAFQLTSRSDEIAPGSQLPARASLALRTNRPRETIEALRRLDVKRRLQSVWIGYWWALTAARHMLGEHQQELHEAREARMRYSHLLLPETRALAALGRITDLERLLDENTFTSAQQRFTPADALRNAAIELRAHGHAEAARRAFDKALAWYAIRPGEARQRLRAAHAETLYEAQHWAEARVLLTELAAEAPANVDYLGRLGVLAARAGEKQEAGRLSTALAASTQPYLLGAPTLWRARIAAQLGDHAQALTLLRQALSEGQPYELWLHTDLDLDPLRDLASFRELIRPKRDIAD
jgi:hypothetical protein